jgi:hypothetical protein
MRPWTLIILALFLISCGDDDPKRPDLPPAPPLQATSPEEVTDLLLVALEGENIERYDSLLTRDYIFIFDPLTSGNDSTDIPESWGLPQEIEALTNMFADSTVEGISVQWTADPPRPPDLANTDLKVILRNAFFEVRQRLSNGEVLFMQAAGDCWLHLRKERWTTADGDSVWKVVWWEDKTILTLTPEPASELTTWGGIKAVFR